MRTVSKLLAPHRCYSFATEMAALSERLQKASSSKDQVKLWVLRSQQIAVTLVAAVKAMTAMSFGHWKVGQVT